MSSFQKVIKYAAIAFGLYLAFWIISSIIFGFSMVIGITTGIDNYKNRTYSSVEQIGEDFSEIYEDIKELDIKIDVSKLVIKKSNQFKVEVSNPTDGFYCKKEGNTLKIRDERNHFEFFNVSHEEIVPYIVLYIPEDIELQNIDIKAGISETNIENLNAKNIDIETGVGRFSIDNIIVEKLKITGGAGNTEIRNAIVDTLKLSAGIGKFTINTEIKEEAKIEAGVGNLDINLKGNKEDYKIKTETGIGKLTIDGKATRDDETIGNGKVYIKVQAGVGTTTVDFD